LLHEVLEAAHLELHDIDWVIPINVGVRFERAWPK
jgi:hypothetical protein